MINASIGGTNAKDSLCRFEKQVLKHDPDLIIICFGLNDVNGSLEDYLMPLESMFRRCALDSLDVIFMTPNMLNKRVADDTPAQYYEYAIKTAEMQNSGKMDQYIYSAIELAKRYAIPVCDCYSKWKELSKTQDVTMLLDNRINHPISEMHQLFADCLYDMIIGEARNDLENQSLMVKK